MSIDDSKDYDLLDRLAGEFADRLRRGERPTVREYAERYPGLADLIREAFPALVTVEEVEEIVQDRERREAPAPALSQVGDYRIVREVGHGGMGVVYEAEQVSLGRRVALKVLPWPAGRDHTALERFRREARASARLHHTNIVPVFEIGHEGDVQYYAMQFIQGQSLDAVIDELRRLRGGSLRGPSRRPTPPGHKATRPDDSGTLGLAGELGVARSLLTGRFDPGPAGLPAGGGAPTASDGPSSAGAAALDSSAVMPGGAQLSTVESRHRVFHRGAAHIGCQVALALAHAHARGILHRDIKPSNLLLDTEGVVWVSDFGLAKVDDDALTRTGDILGTLRYMAPERFRGLGDARADLYSLGLTLYELLTLRPAFDSPDRVALSEQIKALEPPRPRSIDPRISRDLETIVLKAIEKDPRARYATAEAMAEDLRRFLDDEPILARRAGAPERYLRWARRNPAIATLGGALTLVLLVATISSALAARRLAALAKMNEDVARSERGAKITAEAAQGQAELQRERAEQHLYTARIGQAESALRLYDAATARGLLDQCRPGPGENDRRDWEWSYLHQWCNPELRTIALPTDAQSGCLDVSSDGRLLAVGCWNPDAVTSGSSPPVPAYVIGLPDGQVRHELVAHTVSVCAVAFRPDGKRLATLGDEGTIRIWDTASGRPLQTISLDTRMTHPRGGLSWSPDGRRLVGTADDCPVRIWDPETGQEINRIAQKGRLVAWSPDGNRIAIGLVADLGLEVRPWDARTGRLREPVLKQRGWVGVVCWSPDSRRLAATWTFSDGSSPRLTVCDATSGERVFQVDNPALLQSIAFSPDGTRVATCGEEEVVRVFDAADGRARAALFTGANQATHLAFSPDGRRLHAAGWGMGGVKVLGPARDPRGWRVPGWHGQIAALTFDREGLRILSVDWAAGSLTSVDPVAGDVQRDRLLPVTDSRLWPRGDFAFSPDGGRLAAPTRRNPAVVGIWDVALGRPVAALQGSGGPVTAIAFRPDAQALATAASGGPNGRPIVTIWHLSSGRPIRTFEVGPDRVETLAFSGDGRRLAAGGGSRRSNSGWVAAWEAESGAALGTLDRVGLVMSLAFHPDGVVLAVAEYGESKVHLWDLAAGTRITKPGPGSVSCVEFTPDGKRLAALGYDGNVHLTDARTGEEVLVLRTTGPPAGGGGFTPRLAFSPDGSRIVANTVDNLLNVWDLGPASALAVEPAAGDLSGWLRRSRALAERDDATGADAAVARARAIAGGDGSPWIAHAAWLYRRGDSARARDALARVMEAPPDDLGRWLDLGRGLGQSGRMDESATVLARARSLCEQRLARAPDDEAAAAVLAELLPPADASAGWIVLRPDMMASAAGVTLTPLPDGSILAGGPNPPVDTYTLEAKVGRLGITALRLEALTDPSLPGLGPGRQSQSHFSGNYFLTSIRLSIVAGPSAPGPVDLRRARADYSDRSFPVRGVSGAIDADPNSHWSISPLMGRPHQAVFQAARPIEPRQGMRLRLELVCGLENVPHTTLGRFRLSVTDRPFPLFQPSVKAIKADTERGGLTRLGAAYVLLGDWAPAAAVLNRAAGRPEASALDDLLLALAKLHLGRLDEARSDCDRGLARLGGVMADEATHDVAIEALSTIRGLGIDEAESLLLDRVLPAEPFAP